MPETTLPVSDAARGRFTAPFALDLFHELRTPPGNLCFSPLGIASVLVLAQAGAAGQARMAIENVLHCGGAGERLLTQVGALLEELKGLADEERHALQLDLSAALWTQAGYPIGGAYLARIKEEADAEAGEVDFVGDPPGAVRRVNAWFSGRTGGRITDVLSEEQIHPLIRSILASAIYLKAPWSQSFSEWQTGPAAFRLADGAPVEVPTMVQESGFYYWRDDVLQVVRLGYRNRRVAMLVVVPHPGDLERVERQMDAEWLIRVVESMETRDLKLYLPRFRIRSSLSLRRVLEDLGMASAFGTDADFTQVSSEPGFGIDAVFHESFVNVDESGTEAAGATFGQLIGGVPHAELELRVDRPFLFVIRDEETETILFMGRVMDPRS